MKKILKSLVVFLLLTPSLCGCLSGCGGAETEPTAKMKTTYEYFGTASVLAVYDDFSKPQNQTRLDEAWAEIRALLSEIDGQLSVSVETSDVARFNAAGVCEPVQAGEHTLAVLRKALEVNSDFPKYDPTVYPLVDLWGLTPRFNSNNYSPTEIYDRNRVGGGFPLPDETYIDAFVSLADFGGVSVDFENGTVMKTLSVSVENGGAETEYAQKLDLGGIAKGYAVEKVMEILKSYGYEYGYFSCGTSSLALLARPESADGVEQKNVWSLAVQMPRFEVTANFAEIYCKNVAVSTSGDYQHCYFVDGVRYSHIVDPASGYPAGSGSDRGVAAVTLIGSDAAKLDATSTALCLMNFDEIISLLNDENFDCYALITFWAADSDCCEVVTNMPENMYKILDDRFVIVSEIVGGETVYSGNFFSD